MGSVHGIGRPRPLLSQPLMWPLATFVVPLSMAKQRALILRMLFLAIAATFAVTPIASAQSCSGWWVNDPVSYAPEGPYSTSAQACSAYDYGPDTAPYGVTTTITYALGGVVPGSVPTGYYCTYLRVQSGSPAACAFANCFTASSAQGESVSLLGGCTNSYFVEANSPQTQVGCPNCVKDPINPAVGNVFETETDVEFAGPSPIRYQRFYNSADTGGADGVPAWRHSFDRTVTTLFGPGPQPPPPTKVSPQYQTASDACTTGFTKIQSAVSAWAGATASYANNICTLSNSSGAFATLPVYSVFQQQPTSTATEYDVTRDDGQLLRYPVVDGVITNPPGISIRLAVTPSGLTVTDDDDNVEIYNSAGALQSITSRSGVVQTISYDGNGLFLSAADSFGNSVTVSRNTISNIMQLSVSGGGTVQYGYDNQSRLSTVTNLDGTTRSYQYNNSSFSNDLIAEIDENGTTYTTWTYNDQDQAVATQEAGGAGASTLTYNPDGSVTWIDALLAQRTFAYTRVGDIDKVSGIGGSQCPTCQEMSATTYDSNGWVASRTDYNGNLTCYQNDPVRGLELARVEGLAPGSTCPGNLLAYVPVAGTAQRKITTVWSTAWREPSTITEFNRVTSFSYDGYGNVLTKTVTDTSVSPNATRTWTYQYFNGGLYGQVQTATGPRTDISTDVTNFTYYNCTTGGNCGQVDMIANALNQVTTVNTYNAYGQPLTITDPNGVLTTFAYDSRERVVSKKVDTELTAFSYWPTGLLKTVTLPDGSGEQFNYDGAHRLTNVTDNAGNSISYTLDALGNLTAVSTSDPNGTLAYTHTSVFNALSQLYQDINAAGTAAVTTTVGYDPNGNLTSVAAPLSRYTSNQFDALNRLIRVTDPNNGVTQLQYDANDNLVSVTDPLNLQTGYSFDGFNEVTQTVSPDSGKSNKSYDSAGNLQVATDARGAAANYTFDALNRLTSASYRINGTTDQTITLSYDAGTNGVGRLTGASDANQSLAWAYDALGRVNLKSQTVAAVSLATAYSYVNADLINLTTPSGQIITYGYSNHEITSVTVNTTPVLTGANYEPFGSVNGWAWGNGTTEVRLYNTDGIPSLLSGVESISLSYDSANRISGITNSSNSALSWVYGYDGLDRLTTASETGTSLSWTYDANGNRLQQTGAPASAALSPTGTAFVFDARGRLATATLGTTSASYVYNALGQLIEKDVGGTVTLLAYDEAGHLLGEYNSSGGLIEETVWLRDLPVATIRPNGSGVVIDYVHADQLGSPRMVTRPSDNGILWRWDADPFGTVAPNQNPAGLGTFVYNLRFPGQYYQAETGLMYNYFRDYDPQTGRYIESDPIGLYGGSWSTYAYAGDNPVSYIDPLGLTQCDIDTARAIAAAANLQLSTGQPLMFPNSYGSMNLGYTSPGHRRITGLTLPGVGTILSDYYQQVLNNQQAAELLDTIIHEAVHYTLPIDDPRQDDNAAVGFPYSEANRLTTKALIKKLNAERKDCSCGK